MAAGATISEIIEAVRQRQALLAPETAGYLALAVADQLAAAPVFVDESRCGVLVDGGSVVIKRPAPATGDSDAETAVRLILKGLLAVASGQAPALRQIAASSAVRGLAGLTEDIESALIP